MLSPNIWSLLLYLGWVALFLSCRPLPGAASRFDKASIYGEQRPHPAPTLDIQTEREIHIYRVEPLQPEIFLTYSDQ